MVSLSLCQGILSDVRKRLLTYNADWSDAFYKGHKRRVLAAGIYIFFASAMPALAFGQQIYQEADGILNVVHVLTATAITGTLQAIAGGQPLLIVGVAEPIALIYIYMYDFAKDKSDLNNGGLFLPWAAWTCVWTSIFIILLSVMNVCRYIEVFTRFAGELFGMLIALLFLQQAIKGLIQEFERSDESNNPQDEYSWRLVNGIWSLFLGFGFLLTSMLTRTARKWRFLTGYMRAFLADYGVPLMVVAWSGLSFALSGTPTGIPARVDTPDTWNVQSNWAVTLRMKDVPSAYIAGALIPATIITVLFYFDHNVSSKLAQQKEFNLKRASAYHYDFFLLGLMTAVCGLLGLPPVNGVLPQAPMHTKALCKIRAKEQPKTPSIEQVHSGTPAGAQFTLPVDVIEQRVSGLLQSLLVGVCLAITPVLRQIPTAVIWGYFAYMAIESLPGNQFWDRILLILTDPGLRHTALEKAHFPYLQTVDFRIILQFTLLQCVLLGIIYGVTWAGIVGVIFPVFIMLLVPFRIWVMPRIFRKNKHCLEELDAFEAEEAPPLPPERARQEAERHGLGRPSLERESPSQRLEDEIIHHQIKHHLTEYLILSRRNSL